MKSRAIASLEARKARPTAPKQQQKSWVRASVRMLALFAAILCLAGLGLAQSTNSGAIRGTVTDATGAVVPGVKVTVLNVDTGVSKDYTTNDAGLYDTVSTVTGRYRVTFSKAGFGTLVRDGIDLQVGAPFTVNGQLTVGSTSERVEVVAEAPLMKTETAEQSTNIQAQTIAELPNVGRDWSNITKTLPGTVGNGIGVTVNGVMPFYANWLADGGAATNPHSANVNVSTVESIAEVQINTSSFSAVYGTGSIVFNQISKGGTNQWHGSLFEFVQNNAFNARSFFQKGAPIKHYNNFGGSVAGPIIKNKAFFFFNAEKTYDNNLSTGIRTYPTDAMKAGNFAGADATGLTFQTIYDPTTYSAVTQKRLPFANQQIPLSRMDPVSLKVQQYFPKIDRQDLIQNNLNYSVAGKNPWMKYFGRMDYQLTDANRLTMSVTKMDTPAVFPDVRVPDAYIGDIDSYNAQISDVWTFTPTLVNEARMSYHREHDIYKQGGVGEGYPQKLGWTFSQADMFPNVGIGGPQGGTGIGQTNQNAKYAQNTYSPSDTVTWIHGKHILHFGGELFMFKDNDTPWGNVAPGTLSFSGNYTREQPGLGAAGLGYADFLLGAVGSFNSNNSSINGNRETQYQLFVQDDFKLRPNITLNLGIRWQTMGGWREKHNRMGAFDPNLTNPATGALGAMWYAPNNGRTAVQATVKDIILPRIGIAWSVTTKWVVRGGFGVFTNPWSQDWYAGAASGLGYNTSCSRTDSAGITPIFNFSDANPFLNCAQANRTPEGLNNQGVNFYPYNTPAVRNYQWNLSFQRMIGGGLVGELAYVGNHTTNLPFNVNINQVPYDKLQQAKAAGITNTINFRPYPQYSSVNAPGGYYNAVSNYNALQLSIKKRLSSGLSFDANYTFSKMLSEADSSGWSGSAGGTTYQSAYNNGMSYARSNLDRTHLFKASGVYQFPIGKGRKYLSQGGPADWVIGGWQLSSILQYQSGQYFTPTLATNNLNANAGTQLPNMIGNPVLSNPTIDKWFEPAAFVSPGPWTFGGIGRNILLGPSLSQLDMSMAKSFAVPKLENGRVQIRLDSTNIINHPSFSNPNSSIGGGSVGKITGTSVGGRTVQLGARLSF